MRLQPDVTLTGVVSGSVITATWGPKGYLRQINRLRVTGPIPSNFDVYLGMVADVCKIATTTRGDTNQADFSNPLTVPAGTVVYFVWSNYSTGATSTVTVGYSRDV